MDYILLLLFYVIYGRWFERMKSIFDNNLFRATIKRIWEETNESFKKREKYNYNIDIVNKPIRIKRIDDEEKKG